MTRKTQLRILIELESPGNSGKLVASELLYTSCCTTWSAVARSAYCRKHPINREVSLGFDENSTLDNDTNSHGWYADHSFFPRSIMTRLLEYCSGERFHFILLHAFVEHLIPELTYIRRSTLEIFISLESSMVWSGSDSLGFSNKSLQRKGREVPTHFRAQRQIVRNGNRSASDVCLSANRIVRWKWGVAELPNKPSTGYTAGWGRKIKCDWFCISDASW